MKTNIKLFFLTFISLFLSIVVNSQSVLFVTINTQPEDAKVIIDGKQADKVNGFYEISEGKHDLKIEKYGFFSSQTNIKVNRKKTVFNFALKKDPNIIIPVEAEVIIEEQVAVDKEDINEPELTEEKEAYSLNIEMITVKGGTFLMGKEGRNQKLKLHEVVLSDFQIGKYEVTQEQWQFVMGENPSKFEGMKHPVDNISWDDIQLFIQILNEKTGLNYRLPTEAEWEFAARGGENEELREVYAGSSHIEDVAWYWRNSGDTILSGRWDNEIIKNNNCQTKEVGLLKPNALGIYDMTGNVWEWCSDWYSEDYYVISPKSNPIGPENGKSKVYRGGSFVSKQSYCPIYYRFSGNAAYGYNYLGFRLVL